MDVKKTFLNGKLLVDENITQPEGFSSIQIACVKCKGLYLEVFRYEGRKRRDTYT